ncbi:MAG: hypothetical protein O7G85_09745 [Planctomycetota bacterium]|nr:hypothetical protein [Planctomycetota bacterium]
MRKQFMAAFGTLSLFLVWGPSVHADLVDIVSEHVDFSQGYVNADGSLYNGIGASSINSIVSNQWATFTQNFVTLRFYAVYDNPADRMVFFGSTSLMPLDIGIISPSGQQFFDPVTSNILPPDLLTSIANTNHAFDSFLTIGAANWRDVPQTQLGLFATPTMPTTMLNGLHVAPDADGIALVPTYDHDGNPGTPNIDNPLSIPDASGRVLYAQITVPRGTQFSFNGTIGFRPDGSGIEIRQAFSFASVPIPGALSLLVCSAVMGRSRRRRST